MKKMLSHFTKIVIIWVIGFIVFTTTLPKTPQKFDKKADAIVVLTGDSYRISAGFDLYKTDWAEKLFISGVYPGTTVMDLARPYLNTSQMTGIELDDRATNTRENSIETAKWVRKNKYESIILVTSDYHIRRAWIHFQNQMPDLTVTLYPVISSKDKGKRWFTHYKGIKTMVRSYNKLIATFPLMFIQKITS